MIARSGDVHPVAAPGLHTYTLRRTAAKPTAEVTVALKILTVGHKPIDTFLPHNLPEMVEIYIILMLPKNCKVSGNHFVGRFYLLDDLAQRLGVVDELE